MVIVFDANRMFIWAGALPVTEDFDRILEVPLVIIKEIVIRTEGLPGESQLKDMGYIHLVLDNNNSAFCYLDSVAYIINQICMMQTMGDLEEMANLLCDLRPGLEVTDESRYLSQAPSSPQNDFRTLSQRSSRSDMIILNPDNNEQVSAQPVDDKLSKVSNTKAIMTIETETGEKAGSKTSFGLDGLDDSNNEQDDIDELSNDFPSKLGSKTQAQKDGWVSKKPVVTRKQLALAAKSKAKTPLWKTQKSKIGTQQTPISTEPTPTTGIRTAQLKKDRVADVKPSVSDQNIEDCFTELRRKFPSESEPRLRGAAVSSNGDYGQALGYLTRKLQPTKTQPERTQQKSPTEGSMASQLNGKLNGFLHGSSSIPGDGADNPSASNVIVAAKADPKKVAKAANTSTATAQTENRSQQLKNELAGAKKTGTKKCSVKPTPVNVYDIQADEQKEPPTKATNAAKGVKSTTKPPTFPKKATSKDTKSKAPTAKKRQSAPAALQPTAAATRTQRSAAAKASQKMKGADESEDDIEDVEEVVVKNTKTQPAPKGRKNSKTTKSEERVQSEDIVSMDDKMQPPPKGKKDVKTAVSQEPSKPTALQDLDDIIEPNHEAEVLKLQEEDARSLGLINETHQDLGSEGDLYDASPKRSAPQPLLAVKNIIKPAENMFVAPKRKTKSEGSMALKLDSVLSALDDSPATNSTKFDTLPGTVESEVRSFDDVQPPTPKKKGFQAPSEQKEVGPLESVTERPSVVQLITEQVVPSPVGHKSTTDNEVSPITDAVEDPPEVEEINKKTPPPAVPPKRKEVVELSFPSKRTRLNPSNMENEEPILQESPLRGGKKTRNRKSPRKSNGLSPNEPIRRSPRLMERAKDTSTKPSDILSDIPLVDDHLARKTPVISFGNKGARNQGQSSTLRAPAKVEVDVHTEPSPEDNTRIQHNPKRKRKTVDEAENICPPKKRLSISPENVSSIHENIGHNSHAANELDATPQNNASNLIEISDDDCDMDIQDDGSAMDDAVVQGLTSSPPSAPQTKPQFGRKVARHRASRPSSQGSRVDANGSPMAPSSPQIDRIRKIERKLLEEQTAMSERADKDATNLPMQRSPAIFGPRLRLESLPKAKPSSPHDEVPRYVPHKTARNGSYEGVSTKEAVIPEEKLADPFIEKPERRSSGFTDRLLAEISNPDNVPDNNTLQAAQSKKNITKPAEGLSTLTTYAQRSLDGDCKIQLSEKTVAEQVVPADEGLSILNAIVKSRKPNAKSQLSKEVIVDEVASAVDDVPILTELVKKSSKGGKKIQLANKTASQEEVSPVEELPVVNVIPRKSLKGDRKTQPANETAPKDVAQPLTDLSTLTAFAKKSLKGDAKTKLSKKISQIFMEDNEETLVNSDNQPPSDASPSEMTSGSSAQSSDEARSTSRDSQPSSPLTEKEDGAEAWKLAIRPHYQNLSNTAHRIVDVSPSSLKMLQSTHILTMIAGDDHPTGGARGRFGSRRRSI
jgi:hypothetical protein